MRLQKTILLISALGKLVTAQSPPGVYPQVLNLLLVNYGGTFIKQGQVVSAEDTKNMPQLALPTGQTLTNGIYLMVMLDIDQDGANFKKRQATSNQPEDSQHANGQDTYLQAIVQDFTVNTQKDGNGELTLNSKNIGPVSYTAPNPVSPDGHRYLIMLFDQPSGWSLPSSLKQAVSQRTNFDIRNFISEAGLTVPVYSNWMIISPQGRPLKVSTIASVSTLPGGATITVPITTTVPVNGSPSTVASASASASRTKSVNAAPTSAPNFNLAGGAVAMAGLVGVALGAA